MPSATNDNTPSISIPVIRGAGGGIDQDAMLAKAVELFSVEAESDRAATEAVVNVTEQILSPDNAKYAKFSHFTPSTLAKLAVGMLGDMPTDKFCAEQEVRVKAYLLGQPEKFLHIARGRNSGFWVKDRCSAEQLAKLAKETAATE
jgi:hypothetical protein